MQRKLGKDSLLYFVTDKSAIEILKAYTEQNNLWLREADDIVDLYACDSRLAVVEKSFLMKICIVVFEIHMLKKWLKMFCRNSLN